MTLHMYRDLNGERILASMESYYYKFNLMSPLSRGEYEKDKEQEQEESSKLKKIIKKEENNKKKSPLN